MSFKFYKCPCGFLIPFYTCWYPLSRQHASPLLNWPTEKYTCPLIPLTQKDLYKIAQDCDNKFVWVCFTNDLADNNGWWILDGVAGNENDFVIILERPNNYTKAFKSKDIININHCLPLIKVIPSNWPKENHPCPSTSLTEKDLYKIAQDCKGNFVWICFNSNLAHNNGWWILDEVTGTEDNFTVVLENLDNYSKVFESKDITSIGHCTPLVTE